MTDRGRWLRRNPHVYASWDRFGQIVLVDPATGRRDPVDVHMLQILGAFEVAKPISMALDAMPPRSRRDLHYRILSLVESGFLIDAESHPPVGSARPTFAEYPPTVASDPDSFAKLTVHRGMLLDRSRVRAYQRAIGARIEPGMTVVDLGAGTGLLGFLALEAGADRVIAIEASAVADQLAEVVAASGLKDRFEVIHARSQDVELDRPADALVTETLGHVGFDEGILDALADAGRRLLAPEAVLVPASLDIRVAPVDTVAFHQDLADFWSIEPFGIDLGPLRTRALRQSYLTRLPESHLVTAGQSLARLNLDQPPPATIDRGLRLEIEKTTSISGLLLWFVADLGAGVLLDARACSSWRQVFLPVDPPLPVRAGERLQIALRLDCSAAVERPSWSWEGGVVGDRSRRFGAEISR